MPFVIALAVSVMIHAAAIVMPGWSLPGDGEAEPTLDAELAPPPPPKPVAVAPKPKPRPHPARRVRPPREAAPDPDPASAAASPDPAPQAVAEPAPPTPEAAPVPPSPPWPDHGRLRYVVRYGDGGFIIGETVQEWRVEDGHYSIRSVADPKGLAALRGRMRTQTSTGEVTATGLRPLEFRDQREGREAEVASFDWAAGQASFSGGRAPARLADGAQDMISVFYQLAWLILRQDAEVWVATGSRLGRWTVEWAGEEPLELPSGGRQLTRHVRIRSDGDLIEAWLAPAFGGLPVKIRYVDRKGDAFEQSADAPETQ